MNRPSVVLSYGLGVDSTAILLRWLLIPSSRDFDLRDLLVITAMTGNEWPRTGDLVVKYILPLLRQHHVRYVQVARAGPRQEDGVDVLDDSRHPTKLFLAGSYTLADELLAGGTVVQMMKEGPRGRICTQKAKGWPMDQFVSRVTEGHPYRHVVGYELEEPERAERDLGLAASRRAAAAKGEQVMLPERIPRFPLIEWGWDREACKAFIWAHLGEWRGSGAHREWDGVDWPKSACFYCLSGDTEVVTRHGIRPIHELAGGRHRLLVPQMGKLGGLHHRGSFQEADVLSFGVQPLYEVSLRRTRSTMVVRATAEHRWLLTAGKKWREAATYERTTATLRPGDSLRTLRASGPLKELLMSVAVAQGFVFGDGSHGHVVRNERPASAVFYLPKKDSVLLKFFSMSPVTTVTSNGQKVPFVYGLPRFWKRLPPLDESRAFLLSWLAGYFAADGDVTKRGQATLNTYSLEAARFVRDVAAVCGVGCTGIRPKLHLGFGAERRLMYRVNLRVTDLPKWFFLIREHRRRVTAVQRRKAAGTDFHWRVESVTPLGVSEEVFCAVVPGQQAFGLAGDLMTGNCPFALSSKASRQDIVGRLAADPKLGILTLTMERVSVALNPLQGIRGKLRMSDEVKRHAPKLWAAFERSLERQPHALYAASRAYTPYIDEKGRPGENSARQLVKLAEGTREEMERKLARQGDVERDRDGIPTVWIVRRAHAPKTARDREQLLAVAPATAIGKTGPAFDTKWVAATELAGEAAAGRKRLPIRP